MAGYNHNVQLSNLASAYRTQTGYIADMILPNYRVPDITFQASLHDREWSIPETQIGKFGDPARLQIQKQLQTYNLQSHAMIGEYSLVDIEREMRRPMQEQTNVRTQTMIEVMEKLNLARERDAANLLTAVSTYDADMTETLSGSSQWSDRTSDPIGVIAQAAEKFIALKPNCIVMGSEVFARLRNHPAIVEAYNGMMRMNAASRGNLMEDQMAMVFGVEKVLVGMTRYNTATPGADESLSRIWGKHVILAHCSAMTSLQSPMPIFGVTAKVGNVKVYTYESGSLMMRGSDGVGEVKVSDWWLHLIVSKTAGYLIRDAVQ